MPERREAEMKEMLPWMGMKNMFWGILIFIVGFIRWIDPTANWNKELMVAGVILLFVGYYMSKQKKYPFKV